MCGYIVFVERWRLYLRQKDLGSLDATQLVENEKRQLPDRQIRADLTKIHVNRDMQRVKRYIYFRLAIRFLSYTLEEFVMMNWISL